MNDPYLRFTDPEVSSWKSYYEYFRNLCLHTRKIESKSITLKKRELQYLSYFVKHPASSAYDIEPGRKTNQSNYRYAKLALNKFHRLKLIKVTKLEKEKKNQRYPTKKYSLTDHGVYFLISRTKISRTESLQELFKNYHNLNIFKFLVYPNINLETIISPKFSLHFLIGIGRYLMNLIEKMELKVSLLERKGRADKAIYYWNYNKLENYLRKKYHYELLELQYSEENSNDFNQEIIYFDLKNKNNEILIKFDKQNKKGYIITKNRTIKRHEIPFITDYLTRKVIPYNTEAARNFYVFCGPSTEEFIMSVFPFFKIVREGNILELLTTDRPFNEAIKTTKNSFDTWYKLIMSLSNPSF